ncbi:IPT/TIG domain-containing protein [Dysgonomonas macrotermitis]|uniref:IPT/TIG domain-containing protein n=2 Tax=Dysgonomonas macrotermitis TaxID=1346286 RepID=A0A1M4VQA4_9BACT|nr:IPT/TIG domain-containing protein [Dysgonomonas macrotermitis]
MICACLLLALISSCKDDNDSDGTPVIHSVRVTNPEKVDSTFTEASRGQLIVIQGERLHNALEVYINDQNVGFNKNYNTSTHLIVTIPEELKLHGEDSNLKNEIRVVTNHGEASYGFHVLAPVPTITRYSVELTETPEGNMEVVPGQRLDLFGENFYEVERIYLTNINPEPLEGEEIPSVVEEYDMQSYDVTEQFTRIIVSMPATIIPEGFIVVECYSGKAYIPFSSRIPKPTITAISSDMPIPGTKVTIYGTNFLEITGIDINGEYTIPAEDLTISDEADKITFTLPSAPSSSGKLKIITGGGEAEIDFYPYENLVIDFDPTTSWWFSWGANEKTNETGANPPLLTSGNCYGVDGKVDNQWWYGVWNFGGINFPTVITDATLVKDIEVRFEFIATLDFQETKIKLRFWQDFEKDAFEPTDILTGDVAPTGKWITCFELFAISGRN